MLFTPEYDRDIPDFAKSIEKKNCRSQYEFERGNGGRGTEKMRDEREKMKDEKDEWKVESGEWKVESGE